MLTASCPKCAKQVTVPDAARAESRVRCPLCAEEYSLESIFADLPPLLVLLDAPAPNGTSGIHSEEPIMAAAASSVGEAGSSSIFDFGAREEADAVAEADTGIAVADAEEVVPEASSFDFGGDAALPAAESTGAAPRTTTVRPKQKKKASPIKSILGVVVGGLVALPLAQMILWYLPGGWGIDQRDPMSIGRDYPKTFGILAPSWVKNESLADNGHQHGEASDVPHEGPPPDAINHIDPEGSSLGRDDLNGALTGNNTPNSQEGNTEPPPVIDDGNNGGDEPLPPVDEPAVDEPAEEPVANKSPVKDAPSFTTAQLGEELKTAKDAENLINVAVGSDGEVGEKRKAAEDYLQTMSQFAHALTFATERPVGVLEHVHEMLAKASDTPQKRAIVSTLASMEVGKADRATDGTLFMGVVKDIQQRGELFETVVEMPTKTKKPISVYTQDDPQASIAVGDTIAVLGVIVDEPNQNLEGYKGEPDPVVWGGHWQKVVVEE